MNYKIVADSSCDLNDDIKEKLNIKLVPFKLTIEDEHFIDDENIDMNRFIKKMKKSKSAIKSSIPSPGDFLEAFGDSENVFVITISKKLSGTYNSAILAKEMALKDNGDRFIHVFDSKSGSVGETLVALKLNELIKEGKSNKEIVNEIEDYTKDIETYFISQDLNNIIKSGRLSKTKGLVATILNILPIMGSDGDGNIVLIDKVRGKKRAFDRLVEIIGESKKSFKEKILGISHKNALSKAVDIKNEIQEKYNFKDIIIVETKGLSTGYINDKGVFIAF